MPAASSTPSERADLASRGFDLLVDSLRDHAVVLLDPDGRVIRCNAATTTLTGHDDPALAGANADLLCLAEDQHSGLHRLICALAARDGEVDATGWRVRADGSRFWAEVAVSCLRDPDGAITGYGMILRDATGERDESDRLRASNALLRSVLAGATETPIIATDTAGVIRIFNSGAERLLEHSAEEIAGRGTLASFHDPAELAARALDLGIEPGFEVLVDAARHGVAETREWTYVTARGRRIPVSLTVTSITGLDGAIAGFMGVATDLSERKAAERKFEQLLEFAPDAVVGIGRDGQIVFTNAEVTRLFGYQCEELIGQCIDILVPERYRGSHHAHRTGYFTDPRTRPMGSGDELFGQRKDGSEFPAEISLSSVETEDGLIATAAIRDVTEHRNLERSSQWLAAIVESSDDAIIGKRLDGTIMSWNRGAELLYGWTAEDAIGQHGSLYLPVSRLEEFDQILESVGRDERVDHHETVRLRQDGSEVDVSVSASPIRDRRGAITGVAVVTRDISEARRADRKFRELLEFAPDAVIGINRDGIIELVNRQALDVFGYTREELIGNAVEILVPDSVGAGHPERRVAYFNDPKTREMGAGLDLRARRSDGTEFPAEISLSSIETAEGRMAVAAVRDITDRREAEEQLERDAAALEVLNRELARSNEELQNFASVASHDLQEPLRKIQTFSDQLQRRYSDDLPDQGQEYLRRMADAATRMRTLIEDLLSFSRVTTRARHFEAVDLAAVVADVIGDLEHAIAVADGVIDVGDLPTVTGDVTQIRQLVQNLLTNALKFCRPDVPPRVRVDAQALPDGTWTLTIADNGIGFEEEYADRIFGIFERLHGRQEYPGTGIGLAVCRKIAHRHGGDVTATSVLGEGTTFTVACDPINAERSAT